MTPDEFKLECDGFRERFNERIGNLEKRLTTVEVTLWGLHGENGLRSDIKEMKRKVDSLLRFFWVASALPPITFTIVGILKFLGKL
jgi:hypothetical protein